MKSYNSKRLRFLALVLIVVFLSGCSHNNSTNNTIVGSESNPNISKYNLEEIIDDSGKFVIEKLNNVTVSQLKTVGNKQVIFHLGKPYFFHAVHFRYDHLLSANLDKKTCEATFDEGMRLAKSSGFDTVILYLRWNNFFDGQKYDFSEIEYQYSIAKKYDLKIMWNWFGYDVCGFGGYRSWQLKDLEKYPPLRDKNGEIIYGTGYAEGKPIPDLSAQTFIDDEIEALNQFCAWLNVYDTDRRTIGIQLENEPNHTEGGHGLWFSQYSNILNLIEQLGKAIKNGPYSMITYTNLMAAGYTEIVEGRDFKNQVKGLIDLEYLDIVGYDEYTTSISPDCDVVKQGKNPHLMVEFGGCAWSVPAQTNYLISKGFGIGYYHLLEYNESASTITSGIYRFDSKNNPFVLRDGSGKVGGYYNDAPEIVATDFFKMNESIKSISELIAVTDEMNIAYFNNAMKTQKKENKGIRGAFFSFSTDCVTDLYGATGLLIRADNNTYYTYASKSATILAVNKQIISASEGIYKDGKWIKNADVEVIDGKITYTPGKAYQLIIN
ncbi:MAG: hypothetical protein IJA44_01630 [Clostridia bacterium]|nr:hypothetical protein [Clostridia bacterium]